MYHEAINLVKWWEYILFVNVAFVVVVFFSSAVKFPQFVRVLMGTFRFSVFLWHKHTPISLITFLCGTFLFLFILGIHACCLQHIARIHTFIYFCLLVDFLANTRKKFFTYFSVFNLVFRSCWFRAKIRSACDGPKFDFGSFVSLLIIWWITQLRWYLSLAVTKIESNSNNNKLRFAPTRALEQLKKKTQTKCFSLV